jgi:hypothetical protein
VRKRSLGQERNGWKSSEQKARVRVIVRDENGDQESALLRSVFCECRVLPPRKLCLSLVLRSGS